MCVKIVLMAYLVRKIRTNTNVSVHVLRSATLLMFEIIIDYPIVI